MLIIHQKGINVATFQLGTNLVSNPIIILIFYDTKGNQSSVNDTHPLCNTQHSNLITTAPKSTMKHSRDSAGCKIWPENCYFFLQFSSFFCFTNKQQHVDLAREGQGVTFSCLIHQKQKEIIKTLC